MTKERILEELNQIVSKRISEAKAEIESINTSKANETKSSAGDKYETGMAMLQMEEQKANVQLTKANELKKTLSMIDPHSVHKAIQLGSLFETDMGIFFISIGLGKINLDSAEVFTLSIVSPIGSKVKGKGVGDQFEFMQKKLNINMLY